MGKIERLLETELENEIQELGRLQVGTEEHRVTGDVVTKLADRVIELKKVEQAAEAEAKNREFDEEYKLQQLKDEKRDRFIKNAITIGSVVVNVGAAVGVAFISMNFERTDTVTTEAGKSSIRQLLKFKI